MFAFYGTNRIIADRIILLDITGTAHTISIGDIQKREELETSIMPAGLANSLSYEEFAAHHLPIATERVNIWN